MSIFGGCVFVICICYIWVWISTEQIMHTWACVDWCTGFPKKRFSSISKSHKTKKLLLICLMLKYLSTSSMLKYAYMILSNPRTHMLFLCAHIMYILLARLLSTTTWFWFLYACDERCVLPRIQRLRLGGISLSWPWCTFFWCSAHTHRHWMRVAKEKQTYGNSGSHHVIREERIHMN